MIPFRSEITINRPIEQVFRFAADPNNYPKWMSGVTGVTPISSGSLGAGSRVQIAGRSPFGKYDAPMEIGEYEVNRRVGFKATIPGMMVFDGGLVFESNPDSTTHVISSGQVQLQGLWKLLEPLFAGEVRNGEAKELEKIRGLLESGN